MNKDDLEIPLLDDLVSRGQDDADNEQVELTFDEHMDVVIDQDDEPQDIEQSPNVTETIKEMYKDEMLDEPSVKELIIDEEIRLILDKHMDKAYEEIIRLLNHKIT